ncbi:MAG: universal stress protein [Steroidobacteraceae bacterium]|jgi:universal stress protein E
MSPVNHILVVVNPKGGDRQSPVDKAMILARGMHASVELLICDLAPRSRCAALSLIPWEEPVPVVLADALLEKLAAPLRAQGIEVTLRVVRGEALHLSILEYLHCSNASLLVKETHHHSWARRTLLKNTDWYLAHGSTVPLLLTKEGAWARPPKIMAAIDPHSDKAGGAALNRKILRCATSLAVGLTAELHVIHTYIPRALAAAVATGALPATADIAQNLECETSFKQAQIRSLARASGAACDDVHVEIGSPTERLAHSVEQYGIDVAAIGASSHGLWHRMIAGSTASAVLESLPCDLLVVRPDINALVDAG